MTLPAPKHYWNFNETSGTVAADTTGSAVMALDRACWVPGRQGNAVRFNPKDGVRLATTTLPEMPAPWTAAFWVYREADSEGAALWSSNTHAIKLEQWGGTHRVGITQFGSFDKTFNGSTPRNEWVQLTLVATASEIRLYLGGKLQDTLPVSMSLGLSWLGSTQGYLEFASVILDEVKVFDQALTDDQVAELAAAGTGLTGHYFTNKDLSGTPALTRVDATVNFDWGLGSPAPSIPVDNFSARWTGQVEAEYSETYTFTTTSDDGCRLWVNNQLLVDDWTVQSASSRSGKIALEAGQRYDIKMEFFEAGGVATAKLAWSSPSTPQQIVPTARLYPYVELTTGKAAWRVVSAPQGSGLTAGPAPVVGSHPGWTATLPDAQWLGTYASNAPAGEYVFELSFVLGADLSDLAGEIQVCADNSGTIWLNDTQVGEVKASPDSFLQGNPATVVQVKDCASRLCSGENKLQVKVVNSSPSPAGLLLSGWIKVGGGA